MVPVVQAGITGQTGHEQALQLSIGRFPVDDPVSCKDSPCVGIDDEHRPAPRVEENAVGGFLPNPRYPEEPLPRLQEVPREHLPQVAPELTAEYIEKGFQSFRFDPEISRWTDQIGQGVIVQSVKGPRLQDPFRLEPPDGPLHVGPVRVLRQDRPDGYLEGALPRPPVQIPEESLQSLADTEQPFPAVHGSAAFPSPTLCEGPRNRCPCHAG